MSRRGVLLIGALLLLPFFLVGLVRMGCKAQRRAQYSAVMP
jgi:hypothetical protein